MLHGQALEVMTYPLVGEKLLSKKSIEEMFTPFKDLYPGRSYGFGWLISEKFGRREIAHGGNATGFITYFARYPEERLTVIVLSNNASGIYMVQIVTEEGTITKRITLRSK